MMDGQPAGFWIRAVALAIDFALFFLVEVSFSVLAGLIGGPEVEGSLGFAPVLWLFTLIFATLYTSVLHSMCGQTVGKMLTRIRVVGLDDALVGFGTALLRHFAYFASLGTFTLGYLMAGLRRDKRALHDLIAGTRVERVARPAPPLAPVEAPHETVTAMDETSSSGYL
jgi:uncharacterized RDD family membrane protein YckC